MTHHPRPIELDAQQRAALKAGIEKSFEVNTFAIFLSELVDKNLSHYSNNAPLPQAAFSVITGAQQEGWARELVVALLKARPTRTEFIKVAEQLGVAT